MAEAKSLEDLLRIRAANAAAIDRVNDHLGCALGYKTSNGKITDTPAVIIFVPRKVSESLLPASQKIPKRFQGPDGLSCPTDVIVGRKADDEPPSPPLDPANQMIIDELSSGSIGIIGGIQLGGFEPDGQGYLGTAACLVRTKDGRTGLLTNQHVGGPGGRPIYHPDPGRFRIGFTRASFEYDPDEYYFNNLIDEEDAYYRVDCAFVELSDTARSLARPGLHRLGDIGDPLELDLGTMGPIGRRVVSIGRTRGITRGTIMAFGYEWYDEEESIYTDYLVLGDNGQVFSDHGDSGKLIVTDDANRNAVALLWGGWYEKLRRGHGQENWTYAIDVNKALRKLEVGILTDDSAQPNGPGFNARVRARAVARQPRGKGLPHVRGARSRTLRLQAAKQA
jgi:hypothetical protein